MSLYCAVQQKLARIERYHNSVPRLHVPENQLGVWTVMHKKGCVKAGGIRILASLKDRFPVFPFLGT